MADASLVDRLDRSTVAVFEGMTERTPGGRVVRQDGLVLVVGSDPSPVIVNTILTVAGDVGLPALERALELYREAGHVPSLMTRDHRDAALHEVLPAAGWQPLLTLPGMILEARPPREPSPSDVEVHAVERDADRERWIEGNLNGFAGDDGERAALRSAFQTLGSLAAEQVVAFWAEADGRGVGSAMGELDPATGFGVVGWVGTDRAYRRRGIGRAVTLATIEALYRLGATAIALQASPMGLPVYERLGFRTICGYRLWLPPEG